MLSDIYKAIMVELIHKPLFSDLWSVCMLNAVVQQPWSKSRGFGSVFKLLSPPVIRAVLNRCSSVPVVDSTRTYAFTKTTHARTRTLDNRTPRSAWRTFSMLCCVLKFAFADDFCLDTSFGREVAGKLSTHFCITHLEVKTWKVCPISSWNIRHRQNTNSI